MIYLILILGFVLRLISLDQSLWLDEATSVLVARNLNFREIVTNFSPGDFHPPLYYLVLKSWTNIFGYSEIGVRSFSVLVGTLTVWIVFLIGKRVVNRKAGLLASLFIATSGLHIYFSQETRMYSLATFFVSLVMYFFVKTLKESRVGDWVGLSINLFLVSAVHYLSILIIPCLWLYVFLVKKKSGYWKKFLTSHIILVFFWIIWFPTFLKQLSAGLSSNSISPIWWNVLGKTSVKEVLLVPTKFILGRISLDNKFLYLLSVAILCSFFTWLILLSLKKFKKVFPIWIWFSMPVILAALIGLRVSVFSYFRLVFVLPAFYLLVSFGANNTNQKLSMYLAFLVLAINLLSSSVYLFNPRFHRENWRGLVSFIEKDNLHKKSVTLFPANSQMEAYRYYSKDSKIGSLVDLDFKLDQVWLIRYAQPIFDVEDKTRMRIESLGYIKNGEYDFNSVVAWRYVR